MKIVLVMLFGLICCSINKKQVCDFQASVELEYKLVFPNSDLKDTRRYIKVWKEIYEGNVILKDQTKKTLEEWFIENNTYISKDEASYIYPILYFHLLRIESTIDPENIKLFILFAYNLLKFKYIGNPDFFVENQDKRLSPVRASPSYIIKVEQAFVIFSKIIDLSNESSSIINLKFLFDEVITDKENEMLLKMSFKKLMIFLLNELLKYKMTDQKENRFYSADLGKNPEKITCKVFCLLIKTARNHKNEHESKILDKTMGLTNSNTIVNIASIFQNESDIQEILSISAVSFNEMNELENKVNFLQNLSNANASRIECIGNVKINRIQDAKNSIISTPLLRNSTDKKILETAIWQAVKRRIGKMDNKRDVRKKYMTILDILCSLNNFYIDRNSYKFMAGFIIFYIDKVNKIDIEKLDSDIKTVDSIFELQKLYSVYKKQLGKVVFETNSEVLNKLINMIVITIIASLNEDKHIISLELLYEAITLSFYLRANDILIGRCEINTLSVFLQSTLYYKNTFIFVINILSFLQKGQLEFLKEKISDLLTKCRLYGAMIDSCYETPIFFPAKLTDEEHLKKVYNDLEDKTLFKELLFKFCEVVYDTNFDEEYSWLKNIKSANGMFPLKIDKLVPVEPYMEPIRGSNLYNEVIESDESNTELKFEENQAQCIAVCLDKIDDLNRRCENKTSPDVSDREPLDSPEDDYGRETLIIKPEKLQECFNNKEDSHATRMIRKTSFNNSDLAQPNLNDGREDVIKELNELLKILECKQKDGIEGEIALAFKNGESKPTLEIRTREPDKNLGENDPKVQRKVAEASGTLRRRCEIVESETIHKTNMVGTSGTLRKRCEIVKSEAINQTKMAEATEKTENNEKVGTYKAKKKKIRSLSCLSGNRD